MNEKGNRCLQHYLSIYAVSQSLSSNAQALDECLHHFLDQRPSGKNLSAFDRAVGLTSAPFWWDVSAVQGAGLASLALSRVLHFDNAISVELLEHLAIHNPEPLRWAIRYSKLFERPDSPLWAYLRASLISPDWQIFFGVCDRLLDQLKPFDELIRQMEDQLKPLSLLELFSYLSILAYQELAGEGTDIPAGKQWEAYNRIILRKLQVCDEEHFHLSEVRLGESLQRHLSPLLFAGPDASAECRSILEALVVLVEATQERIDYEGSIDWFCFDPECRYQLRPGQPVIFNESNEGAAQWKRTERKSELLWLYWMNRAVQEYVDSGMADETIGSVEYHEANRVAFIKAIRSRLQLQQIYGLGEQLSLSDGAQVQLHHVLLASELTSVFFEQAFIQPFQRYFSETGVVVHALGQLVLDGLRTMENRFPLTWSEAEEKVQRIKGWTVCTEYPNGDTESAKSILKFWTSDLKSLCQQLRQNPRMPAPRLYELPFYKLGRYSFQFPWLVAQQNNLTAAINNLRRVGARRGDLQMETRRVEQVLAEAFKRRGFSVEVGYTPPLMMEEDAGEVDLICHQDGILLLLEVKSGYLRSTRHEVWLHRTNTLRKAAWQLRRKRAAIVDALMSDSGLRSRLGYDGQHPEADLHAWVVDTSIEFDEQIVDGFKVVSREVLEVVLRDEKALLRPLDQLDSAEKDSLFPDGFSAVRFTHVIESGELWRSLC